jgi:hypothetical protein
VTTLRTRSIHLNMKFLHTLAVVTAVACLTSCSSEQTTTPEGSITLSADEVASLLGVAGVQGLKFGDITSGREGVRVAGIAFDDGQGRELEVNNLELNIRSSADFAYSIAFLKIAEVELHDWSTNFRTKIRNLIVESPGDRFLSALQAAMAAAKNGGNIDISPLQFEKLSIASIEHLYRSDDKKVTKGVVEDFVIERALQRTVGGVQIRKVSGGQSVEQFALAGLKIRDVDREWVNRFIANLGASTPQMGSFNPRTNVPGDVFMPFDQFAVQQLSIPNMGPKSNVTVDVVDVDVSVRRLRDGQFAGLDGRVTVEVPLDTFSNDDTPEVKFIREVTRGTRLTKLAITATLGMARDNKARTETWENLALTVPGFGMVTGAVNTTGIADALGLLVQGKPPSDGLFLGLAKVQIAYKDDGLLPYLTSDRFSERQQVAEFFDTANQQLQTFVSESKTKSDSVKFGEMRIDPGYPKAPGQASLTLSSNRFLTFEKFFSTLFAGPEASAGDSVFVELVVKGKKKGFGGLDAF